MHTELQRTLLREPRSIPCKFFYDDRGSQLFDRICDTHEYYPTRTEETLLLRHAQEIVAEAQPFQILELGSGTARKTRHLFDACECQQVQCEYMPLDVCETMLLDVSRELRKEYDWLKVVPLLCDYNAGLERLPGYHATRMYVFLGGTIGNLSPDELQRFLGDVRSCMSNKDYLLVGVDRVKDDRILHDAYNDARGHTAAFNLNILRVLNKLTGADFRLDGFYHEADYNNESSCVEMFLVSKCSQRVRIGELGVEIPLKAGEKILTEISRKYTYEGIESLLEENGYQIERHYEPDNKYYSLVLARLQMIE